MSIDFQSEPFSCLKSFTELRRGQNVFVGDNADARMATFLYKVAVAHNWPSQWHSRHEAGYIEVEFEGKKRRFDIANQTISGKRVFIFRDTPEIEIQWRRQTYENKIIKCVDKLEPNEKFAATQLVQEVADPKVHDKRLRRYPFPAALRALSVSQLEDLGELLVMQCDDQKAAGCAVAA